MIHCSTPNESNWKTKTAGRTEVGSDVRDANTVESLWQDLTSSSISVLYDGEPWNEAVEFRPPKSRFDNVHTLYDENPELELKFHEGTLLLNTATLDERLDAANATVCLVTFDGLVWALGRRYGVEVVPYNTPLRADRKYR